MTTPTMLVNLLVDALVAKITLDCQTNVDESDITYADTVKKGLLQESKVEKNVAIGVTGGDHDNPDYKDGIVKLNEMENIGMRMAIREVGGGQAWWRRGVARIECFFIKEGLTEDQAFEAAYAVLGRVENAIDTTSMNGLTDSYGEQAVKMFCYGNTYYESGGPPRSFIFRGKVYWAAWTERPY